MASRPSFDSQAADWLDFEEARTRILAHARPLPVVEVALSEARDAVLAEDVTAPFSMPPWDNSAMDGYAVRGEDLPAPPEIASLRLVGESRAGARWAGTLAAGQTVRIMTGAPVPDGADTVVRFEDTEIGDDDRVRVLVAPMRGRNVRKGGEDFEAGRLLAEPGRILTPALLALLATAGRARVLVHRRPRVAILSSGDELLPLGSVDAVAAGSGIIDSNSLMLAAQTGELSADVLSFGAIADRMSAVEAALREAHAGADLIVTAGGASVGAHDLFRPALRRLGFVQDFWRIRLRPGSPVSMGTLNLDGRGVPVLGLPGNPSSAFVTFHLFARPFVQRLSGRPVADFVTRRARVAAPIRGAAKLTMFARVDLSRGADGALEARPSGAQGSGLLRPLAEAKGLAVVPGDRATLGVGDSVDVVPLPAFLDADTPP